jgi:hypothetical protein
MLEFLPREQTIGLTFACLVMYIVIYLLLRPAKSYPYTLPKPRYNFAIVLILILCIFFFSVSDWFGYYKEFLEAIRGGNTHMENVYEWLATNIAQNYLVWRLIVWGTGLVLILLTIKRLPIPSALCLLCFMAIMFPRFAYTRTSLAYSLMCFGCALLYDPNKNRSLLSSLIAITIIICSFFFHKSAIFGIAMIMMAIIIRKIDWKIILLFVLFLPLLLYVLRNQISSFLIMEFEVGEGDFVDYMSYGQIYMENDKRGINGIGGIIHDFLNRGPLIMMAVICFFKNNDNNIPKEIKLFMRITVFMVVGALLFRFNLGANTYVLYYRFLNYSLLPVVFCFSYLYHNHYYPKMMNFIYVLFLFGTLYTMSYIVYSRYVNGSVSYGF